MPTKSHTACVMTIDRLLEGAKCGYLWTFTFPQVLALREASARWCLARKSLVRNLGFTGVRVYELHPGGHGLHVHVITRKRYPVRVVRAITTLVGLGRINVRVVDRSGFCYVAKYLQKQNRAPCLSGLRLWGCVGDLKPVRVRDIQVISHRAFCYCKARSWISTNMPIASSSLSDRFFTWRRLAMDYYQRGDFEGYEVWRSVRLMQAGVP